MGNDDAERKNVSMPRSWWEAFELAASAAGQTLSAWLGDAGLSKLPAAERKKLPRRAGRGRPVSDKPGKAKR